MMPAAHIKDIYSLLLKHYGPQHWWPADSAYEVIVGAILTQNTSWSNVEKAISNLREAELLEPEKIASLAVERLEELIRPSGFFRQKAMRLHNLTRLLLEHYRGSPTALCSGELTATRQRLLEIHGVGPETADSILLYAGGRASFVVDAYTLRLFSRLEILEGTEGYEHIRHMFMANLPHDASLFNEFHALIVVHCKNACLKRKPRCQSCPLKQSCPAFDIL